MSYCGFTFSNYKNIPLSVTFCNTSTSLFTLCMAQFRTEAIKVHLMFVYLLSFALSISSQTPSPIISTDPSYYYNLCAPSICNNLTLSYPFSLPTPCRPSPLQTFCPTNESLLLTNPTSTDTFRVVSIDFTDPSSIPFFIASDSLFTCGAHVSRPNYWNYAAMFSLPITYRYGTHFNCTRPINSDSIQGLQNASCLGCEGQDPFNLCYYAPTLVPAPFNCEIYYIYTPAELSFNVNAVSDLRTFLQSGFQVNYEKPEGCRECESTGGRCGSSPMTGSLVCFCQSSVHRTNCTDGMLEDISKWQNGTGTEGSRPSRAVVAANSASASVLLLVVVVTLVVILIYRRKKDIHFNKETISSISPISHVSLTAAQGTPGYAAPEMWLKIFGPVTDKSDVYSYGMLLLEMACRRKNYDPEAADSSQVYFPEWLYDEVQMGEFPPPMNRGDTDIGLTEDEISRREEDEAAVQRMSLVGLWCVQHVPSNRPSMEKAMHMLEGHVEIGIPPHPFPQNIT